MLADEETVKMHAAGAATGPHGLLVASAALPMSVELDVLDEHTAAMYWARSDRFDTVLDLSFARGPGCPVPGAGGLDPAFLGRGGRDSAGPAPRIDDERWVWHIGLDAEASGFLNDLYQGAVIDEARHARLLALFRLEFRDPADMLEVVRGSRETRMLLRAEKRRMGGS